LLLGGVFVIIDFIKRQIFDNNQFVKFSGHDGHV
jgi:hypothetical protein